MTEQSAKKTDQAKQTEPTNKKTSTDNGGREVVPQRLTAISTREKQHSSQCAVCLSGHREEIERMFLDWYFPKEIVVQYKDISIDSIRRHAVFFELPKKRAENIDAALLRLIQRGVKMSVKGKIDTKTTLQAIELYMRRLGLLDNTTQTLNLGINIEKERKAKQAIGLARFGVKIAEPPEDCKNAKDIPYLESGDETD